MQNDGPLYRLWGAGIALVPVASYLPRTKAGFASLVVMAGAWSIRMLFMIRAQLPLEAVLPSTDFFTSRLSC